MADTSTTTTQAPVQRPNANLADVQAEVLALTAAQRQALDRPDLKQRYLGLAVHGVGSQPSGSTIEHILSEFYPLIRRRVDKGAGLAVRPRDEGDPAEVRIWFRPKKCGKPDKEQIDREKRPKWELNVTEVWWAESFVALSFDNFIGGIGAFLWRWVKSPNVSWRPTLLGSATARQRTIVFVCALPFILLLYLILGAMWLLQALGPLKMFMPGWLKNAQQTVVNICTAQLGDMWVYMGQPWESAQIRIRFEERFNQLLALVDQDKQHDIKSVFVIAHSLGAAITFEALSGTTIKDRIEKTFGGKDQPKFYLITVGAALNAAWDVAPESERYRFRRALPNNVQWLSLNATHDPVSAGPLHVPKEVGITPSNPRVVNQMDMFSDHTSYWNNAEQVIAPILDLITNRDLSGCFKMNEQARERRVSVLANFKALAWLIFPLAFILFAYLAWVPDPRFVHLVADWAKDKPLIGSDYVRKLLISPLFWAAVAAAIVAFLYSTVFKLLWNRWDRSVKYNEP